MTMKHTHACARMHCCMHAARRSSAELARRVRCYLGRLSLRASSQSEAAKQSAQNRAPNPMVFGSRVFRMTGELGEQTSVLLSSSSKSSLHFAIRATAPQKDTIDRLKSIENSSNGQTCHAHVCMSLKSPRRNEVAAVRAVAWITSRFCAAARLA